MKSMFKFLSFAAILAVATSPAARADTNSPLSAPGVYFGTGNVNAGFNVVDSGNLELGLSAITRFQGPITPVGNTYAYVPGPGGPPNVDPNDATWDFVFSVNTGTAALNTYTYNLIITDTTTGATTSGDPSSPLLGNATPTDGSHGFQNAENLGFSFLRTPLAFNPNALDSYTIELTATSGTTVVTDTINVVPTPEPSSLILLGSGLMGVAGKFIRRRRIA